MECEGGGIQLPRLSDLEPAALLKPRYSQVKQEDGTLSFLASLTRPSAGQFKALGSSEAF